MDTNFFFFLFSFLVLPHSHVAFVNIHNTVVLIVISNLYGFAFLLDHAATSPETAT